MQMVQQQHPQPPPSLPLYQYSALPGGTWIRVAAIQPYTTCADEQLYMRFELVQFDDPEHKPYAAISYAWNGDSLQIPIICDDQILLVTPSLISALRDVRQSEETVFVWADAICIDQSEEGLLEREHQVSIMDRIFAKASQVLVFLGGFTTQERDAFAMISKFATAGLSDIDTTECKSLAEAHALVMGAVKNYSLPPLESSVWPDIRNILDRPWFTRLWIVQEYAVAQRVSFMLGNNDLMDGETFRKGMQSAVWYYRVLALPLFEKLLSKGFTAAETVIMWIPRWSRQNGYHVPIIQMQRLLRELSSLITTSERFAEISIFRRQWQTKQKTEIPILTCSVVRRGLHQRWSELLDRPWWKYRKQMFFEHCVRTLHFRATDNRDRVYALLGLCLEKDIPQLRVDYNQSIRQVAERVSKHLINRGHGVYLLSAMSLSSIKGKHGWRALLRDKEKFKSEHLCRLVKPSGRFEKDLFHAGGYEESIEVLDDGGPARIAVAGLCVSQIETICHVELPELVRRFQTDDSPDYGSASWWEGVKLQIKWYNDATTWLREMEAWIQSYRIQSETLELECWRALCCGITLNAKAEDELIGKHPDQFDPGLAILKCKEAYKSLWNLFWTSMNRNVALPWDHLNMSRDLQLAMDTHGRVCTVPQGSEVGDLVCILKGFPLPFILRPTSDNTYLLLGACYVKGVMDGDHFEANYPTNRMSFILEAGPETEDE